MENDHPSLKKKKKRKKSKRQHFISRQVTPTDSHTLLMTHSCVPKCIGNILFLGPCHK